MSERERLQKALGHGLINLFCVVIQVLKHGKSVDHLLHGEFPTKWTIPIELVVLFVGVLL